MRHILAIVMLAIVFFSCSEKEHKPKALPKKILNGFGKIKLGMSAKEIEEYYQTKIIIYDQWLNTYKTKLYNIEVLPEIVIDTLYLEFKNDSIILICSKTNQKLFRYFQTEHGIKDSSKFNFGKVYTFESNDKFILACYEEFNQSSNLCVIDTRKKFNEK